MDENKILQTTEVTEDFQVTDIEFEAAFEDMVFVERT